MDSMIAVLFALTLIPVLGMTGSALDYSRAVQIRTKLQSAADAAALAGLSAKTTSVSERQAIAERVFKAHEPSGVHATAVIQASEREVVVEASGQVETSVLKIARIPTVEVGARAQAARANTGLPPCLLALSKAAAPGISVAGKADYESKGCVVHSNSSAKPAIDMAAPRP